MLDRVHQLPAEVLEQTAYRNDFLARWDQIEDVFWKLERQQTFSEPGNDSWLAWLDGNWDDAMRRIRTRLPALVEKFQRDAALGIQSRRIRIVEQPISPYLQWELHALRVRVDAGEHIRILDATAVVGREADRRLPELTILGTRVMYQVLYDETGAGAGGRRIVDQTVIRACRAEMQQLWERAEEFLPFLEREVAIVQPTPGRAR